jgi:hypothetical protein
MFSFLGYNFVQDGNSLDIAPTSVNNVTTVQVQNGIFDHFHLTSNVTSDYSPIKNTEWAYLDIIVANFDGNINGGNVDFLLQYLTAIKVKRRIKGTFNWVTLKTVTVKAFEDLNFAFNDYIAANNTDYEYALVPILSGAEGDYITNSITSQFKGVFICEKDSIYKFYAGVAYGTGKRVKKIGVFEPYGSKYPVIVANAKTNYYSNSISFTVLPLDYEKNRIMNRYEINKLTEEILNYITNNKAKIIKDWNNSIHLVYPSSEPNITYDNNWGMGKVDISFDYVEVGDANNEKDLMEFGLVEPVVSGVSTTGT